MKRKLTDVLKFDSVFTEEEQAALAKGLLAGDGVTTEESILAFTLWAAERVLEGRLIQGVLDGMLRVSPTESDYTFEVTAKGRSLTSH